MAEAKTEGKWYDITDLLNKECFLNLVIGKKGNGKTVSALRYGFRRYIEKGYKMAYVRRWDIENKPKYGSYKIFDAVVQLGDVELLTKGQYNDIKYYNGGYYLAKTDENGKSERAAEPFAYLFSLNLEQHYCGKSWNCVTMIFDEFFSRSSYISDNEWDILKLLISDVMRGPEMPHEDELKVILLGNTLQEFGCVYFENLGLDAVKDQAKGTIDVYTDKAGRPFIAVERCGEDEGISKTGKIFERFGLVKDMITKSDWWEGEYPRLPEGITEKDAEENEVFRFYVTLDDVWVVGEIISLGDDLFVYFKPFTHPYRINKNDAIILSREFSSRPNYFRRFDQLPQDLSIINQLINSEKTFFATNRTGELVRSFMLKSTKVIDV